MNYAKQVLRSKRLKLQNALEDMDKTNHPISDAEKLKAQIESIDKMLSNTYEFDITALSKPEQLQFKILMNSGVKVENIPDKN